ncbi:MAG: IucA/IucC family C-terminal-domain containing protein [Acidimicrobiales bacterium]
MVVVEGPEAEDRVAGALGRVAGTLPYLQASVAPAGPLLPAARRGRSAVDGRWLYCDELLDDHEWLATVIGGTARYLGSASLAVAASLFVLGYSYRVLTLAVSCLIMDGLVPSSRPGSMAIGIRGGRPSLVAYRRARALVLPSKGGSSSPGILEDLGSAGEVFRWFIADAVESHLRLLVDASSSRVRVGRRLLWGNVAASAATAFRTMQGLYGERIELLGERFFTLVPREMRDQGSFLSLERDGRRGWYWERRNCCLNDRLPGHVRCSDCSRTPAVERRSSYLARLARP